MFDIFRKKSQVEKLIETDGIEHAADRFADIICRKLTNQDIAYQFILEELDGASKGNEASKRFASDSGIARENYLNALRNSTPEVDGPGGPQQLILGLCLELSKNPDQMAAFRCKIDDKILRRFGFGKYALADSTTSLSEKYVELAAMMVAALNEGDTKIVDQVGATSIVKESLQNLTARQIIDCRNAVACLFAMSQLADSAIRAGNGLLAKYISMRCRPIGKGIMELPRDKYSQQEFVLIDGAYDILNKVDGSPR